MLQVVRPARRRNPHSLFALSLLLALAAAVGLPEFSAAGSLFAGITAIESHPDADPGVQVIEFQSDLPFRYQLRVIDHNHVSLRIYNARVAENLMTPEGGVNILAKGALDAARLQSGPPQDADPDSQELMLSGTGLGLKKIRINGATELAQRPAKTTAIAMRRPTEAVSWSHDAQWPDTKGKPKFRKSTVAFPNLNQVESQADSKPVESAPTQAKRGTPPVAASTETVTLRPRQTTGPQVVSVSRPDASPVALAQTMAPSAPAAPDSRQARAQVVSPENPLMEQAQPVEQAMEEAPAGLAPAVVMALPRYQGGARPIQAMTSDSQGNPVYIQPINKPLPDFRVYGPSTGYNMMAQATTAPMTAETPAEEVNRLTHEALQAYRQAQYDAATRKLQAALKNAPDNADLYAALAEVQLKQGQKDAASQTYQKAQRMGAGKYDQRYAQILVLAGRRTEAIPLLETLYRQDPKQPQLAYMLGTLHEELGQTAQALPFLKQAATLQPTSADIQYNLGLAYELTGERQMAARHYREALRLSPVAAASDVAKALARVRH